MNLVLKAGRLIIISYGETKLLDKGNKATEHDKSRLIETTVYTTKKLANKY